MRYTLKDIVFAAIISAAMNVVSFVLVPLVVAVPLPGIRNIVVAPFFGFFIALALLKIRKPGTITLVSFFTGAVLLFISPSILFFLAASALVADLCIFLFWRPLDRPIHYVLGAGIYMAAQVPFGAYFGALMLGYTPLAELLLQPWLILGAVAVAFALGALGGFLGVKIGREFRGISLMK